MKKIIIIVVMIVLSTIATQKTFAQDLLNGAVPSGGMYTTEIPSSKISVQTIFCIDSVSIPFLNCEPYSKAKYNLKEKNGLEKKPVVTNKNNKYYWQGDFWGCTIAVFLIMFILMLYILQRRKKK
jgi:hypothetical protein